MGSEFPEDITGYPGLNFPTAMEDSGNLGFFGCSNNYFQENQLNERPIQCPDERERMDMAALPGGEKTNKKEVGFLSSFSLFPSLSYLHQFFAVSLSSVFLWGTISEFKKRRSKKRKIQWG